MLLNASSLLVHFVTAIDSGALQNSKSLSASAAKNASPNTSGIKASEQCERDLRTCPFSNFDRFADGRLARGRIREHITFDKQPSGIRNSRWIDMLGCQMT